MFNLKDKRILGVLVAGTALCGCNVGMAPTGGSPAEMEANFKKEPPEQQIRTIQMSPASPERKAQLIKDIQTKYGLKPDGEATPAAAPPAGGLPPAHG
jgi:hypothetical protein